MKWRLLLVTLLPFLICCKKQDETANRTLTFSNIVILGNSITYAPHNTAIGWGGDWGMAATAQDSDYVHILTRYFKGKNPKAVVNMKNIEAFEVDAANYDFDANLKDLRDLKPDLLILRIAEDVPKNADMKVFADRYTALINYFKWGNQNIIVLCAGSVWSDKIDPVIIQHPPYILFSNMVNIIGSFSFGIFSDPGVALHPSDKGMRYIANTLSAKIEMLTENDRK